MLLVMNEKEIKPLVALNFIVECFAYSEGQKTYLIRRANNGQPIELSSDLKDISDTIATMLNLAVASVIKVDNV